MGRFNYYLAHGEVDGEQGFPQMWLDDYIKYKVSQYTGMHLHEAETAIFMGVCSYCSISYRVDVQREIHYRIGKYLIGSTISFLDGYLLSSFKEEYENPRCRIIPFKECFYDKKKI